MADVTSDIRGFNTPPEIETKDNTVRIIGAAVIILALASAGAYSYEKGMWHSTPKQAVSASELPSPLPPQAAAQSATLPPAVNSSPAVNSTPANSAPMQSVAPVAAPAEVPVVKTTTTIVQTPTKTVRTHVVSHETVPLHRPDTIRQRSAPEQNYVAPNTVNSTVTPEATTPTTTAPQNSNQNSNTTPQNTNQNTAPSPAPAPPSQSVAPQQAPIQAAPQTATPEQSTPNSSNTTPNNTDQSSTPSPQ